MLEKTRTIETPLEPNRSRRWLSRLQDPEILVALGVLLAAALGGLLTIGDYSITIDEWNADDYGGKALAWYLSGFIDRAMFTDVEATLWYYGPWPHVLITLAQSLGLGQHWDVRHAVTFLLGLASIAMLLPMGRMSAGRWAGLAAVVLCFTTGYFYGSLPFTPIDVPFVFAMTAATLAIMRMAERSVPSWPASVGAGLLTGLAIATRAPGFITQAYLVGAMALCAIDIVLTHASWRADLARLGLRTVGAFVSGWALAFCLWPWLQIGNPFVQFLEAFRYFANHPSEWKIPYWGSSVLTTHLPWSYVPGELLVRLPEGFLILLAIGLALGIVGAMRSVSGPQWLGGVLRSLSAPGHRPMLVVWAAALVPIVFVILNGSTLYNGIRHVLFVIPMLAVIAGAGFAWAMPWLRRFPIPAAGAIGAYLAAQCYILAALHPLEYIGFNSIVGGVPGAYQRFDLDYWGAAGQIALRRLEQKVHFDHAPGPKLLMCIPWREWVTNSMYRRPWTLELKAEEADYIIATEPQPDCAAGQPVVLIDEVKRFGRAFAWTYARRPAPAAADRRPQAIDRAARRPDARAQTRARGW